MRPGSESDLNFSWLMERGCADRRILKKHDKRTALTASAGFPSFVRSTIESSNTWQFYSTSLPHVLLASLTDTLLP